MSISVIFFVELGQSFSNFLRRTKSNSTHSPFGVFPNIAQTPRNRIKVDRTAAPCFTQFQQLFRAQSLRYKYTQKQASRQSNDEKSKRQPKFNRIELIQSVYLTSKYCYQPSRRLDKTHCSKLVPIIPQYSQKSPAKNTP